MNARYSVSPEIMELPSRDGCSPLIGARKISALINDVGVKTQANEQLIALTSMAVLSGSLQGLVDVKLPFGKISPVSIMTLIIAGSGERKSTVENILTQGVRRFQLEEVRDCLNKADSWKKEYSIWRAIETKMIAEIAKKETSGVDADAYYQRLKKHRGKEPVKPAEYKFMLEDCTSEALSYELSQGAPHAFLVSSEGGTILDSRLARDTPKLNAYWSGDSVNIDRKVNGSFRIEDPRVTMLNMAQPEIVKNYVDKTNGKARGSGFLARLIVSNHAPMLGGRFSVVEGHVSSNNIEYFCGKTEEFIKLSRDQIDIGPRKVLEFDGDAKRLWTGVVNYIEGEIREGGRFSNSGDHASKLGENIARISALLHCYEEGPEGIISHSTLWSGIKFCAFFSDDFQSTFNIPPDFVLNAWTLNQWFDDFRFKNYRFLKKNYIRQYGPRAIRNKARLNDAIQYLVDMRSISILNEGGALVADLSPAMPYSKEMVAAELAMFLED